VLCSIQGGLIEEEFADLKGRAVLKAKKKTQKTGETHAH
jgi:hypothetical protein